MSNQRENRFDARATAQMDKKLLATNPLVYNSEKLAPSVTRVFRKDQQLYVYLKAYQPPAAATEFMVATLSFTGARARRSKLFLSRSTAA